MQSRSNRTFHHLLELAVASFLATAPIHLAGCYAGFSSIDEEVGSMLKGASGTLGEGAPPPVAGGWAAVTVSEEVMDDTSPTTWNPAADELSFMAIEDTDAEAVLERLKGYQGTYDDAPRIGLQDSLQWAFANAQEFKYAQEEYILSCLALLVEEHRWVPRVSDTISPRITADANDPTDRGFYETALNLVNEWNVTQKLPYGGEVSAGWVATFAKDLHRDVSGAPEQSNASTLASDINVRASIPFLRGAGPVARENLIQAERNIVYAARTFERFRRIFLVRVTTEFLGLQVQRRRLRHAEESIEYYDALAARQEALYEAGRTQLFESADAENSALQAKADLSRQWEQYRLAVDQFKRLIGYPIEEPIVISEDALAIPPPSTTMDGAVGLALTNRLDLQNERNKLVDRQRAIRNARNALLPDLDLALSASIPSDSQLPDARQGWNGLNPNFQDIDYSAGLSFGIPLDREIERLQVRQAQINLERSQRTFILFRDTIVIDVRSAIRDIDANLFALDLQRRNVDIAQLGIESIKAKPDRASVLTSLQAIRQRVSAQDSRDSSFRDVQVSILEYLDRSGQLRVNTDGTLQLLPGMELVPYDDLAIQEPSA